MSADDKYPEESGRRRFVKGVVGGASLAAVGAAGSSAVNSVTSSSGAGGGQTQAMAIENTDGPAPRGMPQIPIEVDSEGAIRGVWPEVVTETQGGIEVEIARSENYQGTGVTYAQDWFQYCGIEANEGLEPDYKSDNYFRSAQSPGYAWQSESKSPGDKILMEDLSDYESWGNGIGLAGLGKPAQARWRSEDAEETIPVQLVRSTVVEDLVEDGRATSPAGTTYEASDRMRGWLEASTARGTIAWLNKCTHFCCVPGFKSTDQSAKFGGEDSVYCPCHQSLYDPFSIKETLFVARPRPGD